ncbi:MAG: DAK2 domain-containing protein [Acidimicrobiales bacterium]
MAPRSFTRALLAAADAVQGSAPELNELDAYAGDGDLGVTMSQAARLLREVVEGAKDMQASQLLAACGAAIARGAPSTSGTLVATGLLRAGRALAGAGDDSANTVKVMGECFSAALEAIAARGKASIGDRTLVDGLGAVCSSLEASVEEGLAGPEALRRAALAAAKAAGATASMLPKAGRASWVPERALGHPDAGCALLAKVLEAAAGSWRDDDEA